METEVLKLDSASAFERSVRVAAEALAAGAVVGLVTDTVYGLVADRDNDNALARLIELKRRSPDQPFTIMLGEAKDLERFDVVVPPVARRLAETYWPGALTLVLEGEGEETLGFRVPAHAAASRVVGQSGVSVVAPSANPHGEPPALSAREVLDYFDGRIECVVDGGRASGGAASTVVAVVGDDWTILREGTISRQDLRRALCRCIVFVCTGNTCRSPLAAALFERTLADRLNVGIEDLVAAGYAVESCGTSAWSGALASEHSAQTARRYGADLTGHHAQPLSSALAARAERIYAMTASHANAVRAKFPEFASKVRLLDPDGDIPDPMGGALGEYYRIGERMWELVSKLAEEMVQT